MTPPIAPVRDADQRLVALAAANEIRYRRASLKRALRSGSFKLAAFNAGVIIHAQPPWALTMKVRNLLVALPGIGDARADRILIRLRINPRKTIAGLSDRQRAELQEWLAEAAK